MPVEQKFAALISYVGTNYCGWQRQSGSASMGAPSIQATIECTLKSITGEGAPVVGSGRTDSGVHALGQVAHFVLRNKEWSTQRLKEGLNSLLPDDIRILCVDDVGLDFHAQRSAIKKSYSFYIQQGPTPLPHLYPFSWWIRKRLDKEAMIAALKNFIGEHDFKAFRVAGSSPSSTVRKIIEADIYTINNDFFGIWNNAVNSKDLNNDGGSSYFLLRINIIGNGFLKQMVRSIVGTLVEIGEGRRSPDDIKSIIESGLRSNAGATAQARGLSLDRVWYRTPIFSEIYNNLK